jgi:hypothetical protein
MMLKHLVCSLLVGSLLPFTSSAQQAADDRVQKLVSELKASPGPTIERLNRTEMHLLMQQRQYKAVEDLATAGTLALPADTWRIEVLQSYRVRALLAENKSEEALHAAKGLFNVCGMGFVKDALPLLFDALAAARPQDPGLVPRLKLQVLAGAREDEAEREREWGKVGGNSIMYTIDADPEPYRSALKGREGLTAWRDRYGTGNLLLLSGKIREAKVLFDQVYATRPDGELRYASEAKAKMIKAEDAGLGRANQFVRSIRPAP